MDCHFGIIEGHVVQLKEMCSPIEGTGSNIGPIWPPKNKCPSLLCLLLYTSVGQKNLKSILMHHYMQAG